MLEILGTNILCILGRNILHISSKLPRITGGDGRDFPPLPIVVPGTKTALQVLSPPIQNWKQLKKDNFSLPITPLLFC